MVLIKNLKVSKKLWMLILPAILALVILLGLFMFRTIDISKTAKQAYYDEIYVSSSLLLNGDRDFYQAAIAEKEIFLSGENLPQNRKEELLADYNENAEQTIVRIQDAIDNVKANAKLYNEFTHSASKQTLKQLSDNFYKHFETWKGSYDESTGIGDIDAKLSAFDSAREEINLMTELLEEYGDYIAVHIQKEVQSGIIILTSIIVMVTIFILALGIIIISYLRKNILFITKDMDALSKNDLSFEPNHLVSKDEIGTLSTAVTTLIHSLRGIVSLLDRTTTKLTISSNAMRTNTDEITTSMHEIASTVGEIAESTSQQATDTEQVVREIDNLGEVINQNTQSSKKLSNASQQIQKVSQDGLIAVTELSEITINNKKSFELIFDTIRETNDNASKIGEVSDLIASVAKQTNLLALNAAIEAARAGEAGKGFAVVAEEIRNLAEQSSRSTNLINSILEALKNNIESANSQSILVKDAVNLQVNSVNDTKERYLTIVDTIHLVNEEIEALDTVSQKMEHSRSEVVDIITSLSAIAEENAASTEETSATTEEVLASMITINEVGEEIDQISKELLNVIQKFKINS